MLKHIIFALAVLCGISVATLAVSGLSSAPAAACSETPTPHTS